MGNIVSVNENGKQHYKYAYDKIGRLILEKDLYKNREVCYTYDNNGNILTKSIDGEVTEYRYKEGTDQLVSFGTESIAYDNMGNPITYKGMTCTWEKGRQLASISDGENTVTYTYDVKGLRTSKTVGGATTNYVYENGKLLRQITDNEVMDFIYGSEGVIGFRIRNSAENTEKNYLYRKNLFGDITEIIDESGALVYEYTYSAFGKSDKEEETGIGAKNPFRYRGYYYDDETGLYYLKSRYYDPETGRFITIDDTSYLDPDTINGLNLYAYCGNNPVMRVDANGNKWWDWLLGVFSVVLTVVGVALTVTGVGGILGGVLISAGISSLIGGITNQAQGGSFGAGWFGGLVGGAISGVIGGIAITSIAWPILGAIGNAAGSFASTIITSGFNNGGVDFNIIKSALINAGITFALSWFMGGAYRSYMAESFQDFVAEQSLDALKATFDYKVAQLIDAFYNGIASVLVNAFTWRR